MLEADKKYIGLPWKKCGHTREGIDCVGLVWLWLKGEMNFGGPEPSQTDKDFPPKVEECQFKPEPWLRGDVLFFRERKTGVICHCAIYLGGDKHQILHIVQGFESRVDNGLTLLKRMRVDCIGAISPSQAEELLRALANPELAGVWVAVVAEIVLSIALSAASYFLQPGMPKLASHGNAYGRYGQTTQGSNLGLVTQKSPEIPLPDLLGSIVVAGNAIYQQLADKGATVTSNAQQMWNVAIVLCAGPAEGILADTALQLNGVSMNDVSFYNGTQVQGIFIDPDQTKAQAVAGNFGADFNAPTVSLYPGDYDITVPVDVRAQYDRNFPVYGFAGCAYLVFRFADATKFQTLGLNLNVRVQGRKCREFDSSGFTVATVTGEAHTADGTSPRIKLDNDDLIDVTHVDVDGTTFTEMAPGNTGGQTYSINRTKGFLHFNVIAVGGGSVVTVNYTHYNRSWTRNPVSQIVYLLTEKRRGKGFNADKIDWPAAVASRDYCDATVDWVSSSGTYSTPRYQTDYAIDFRKPIQDHMQELQDACAGYVFLSEGKFTISIRQPQDSVFSFNTSNILLDDSGNSTFTWEFVDRSTKPNRINLLFHSADTLNAETGVIGNDSANQEARAPRVGNDGVVEENLKFTAVTEISQAERLAQQLVIQSVGSNRVYTWKTNIKGLALQIGDVVDVTHPSMPGQTVLSRIDNLEYDEKDQLLITASEYIAEAYV